MESTLESRQFKALVKPGIRVKFVGILILATVLPLAVAAAAVYVLGNKYYRASAGQIFQNQAQQMANYLVLTVTGHSDALHDYLTLSNISRQIESLNQARDERALEEVRAGIEVLERRWEGLPADHPDILQFLENEIAVELDKFQEISPLFAEIFVTDNLGQLVATTNKTTNYWHGDKHWWKKGMQLGFQEAYIEGVNFDESAEVYSFDLIIPIRDWRDPEGPPAGVAKGVLSAAPLFLELATRFADDYVEWTVVLENGAVLFGAVPLADNIPDQATATLLELQSGWMVRKLNDEKNRQMIGFAPLPWDSTLLTNSADGSSIFVLVHESAAAVLAPLRAQILLITGTGSFLLLLCFLVGMYLAQYHILRPIRLLQGAARNIAASAKLGSPNAGISGETVKPNTREFFEQIDRIRSEDELGELAKDFRSMAERVVNYHSHLEREINSKVAEMQGDLVIAREFQEALMPHEYPAIPDAASPDELTLQFNHIYKPASTVGGDFLNVVKLSEHRAGIFIADVMGHGSRSALVTAIVATLLHDLAPKAEDPAEFMTALNQHFHHLIQHCKQVIFVTAFYLVIDTREQRAYFASAGHPPPLLVQRRKAQVKPLIHPMQNDTALGLLEDSTYACFSRSITSDDMFLLFTDGLFEVLNPMGEEFGVQKLMDVVNHNLEFSASELGQRILDTVNRYSGFAAQSDDICLVTVEVNAPGEPQPAARATGKDEHQF